MVSNCKRGSKIKKSGKIKRKEEEIKREEQRNDCRKERNNKEETVICREKIERKRSID